ncbi:YdiU family protein [Ideonella sp.]|uniref:protein adenylyltransferase SelO n=1 Tax=Ideonella sp. TaxID=1929293 RepID=UPI0035B23F4C
MTARPLAPPATAAAPAALPWTHRFATLGPAFFTEMSPAGLPEPHWVAWSDDCAAALGWPAGWREPGFPGPGAPPALDVFSGRALWPGMRPLASVYSGHQFGVWAGQLGDGRALWLGELDTPAGPQELQLKGGGRTPYSRMGDGRAVLRSSIREFLCSEAMHHLGVPTTRALCVTGSALPVRRERIETAAVATPGAPSFIRFGHFEHFAHHGLPDELRALADHVIAHHYPACAQAERPVLAMLRAVTERTARLMAHWQAVGFAHGVMNTDNMSILGLTIDYGPFGFLDGFDPGHICNHSDERGRYAFAAQPQVAWWNLHALAQALAPLVDDDVDALHDALSPYPATFSQAMTGHMRAKLGLAQAEPDDAALIDDWQRLLASERVDYTIAHRRLCDWQPAEPHASGGVRNLFIDRDAFDAWSGRYAARLAREASQDNDRAARMRRANPKFVLRNHLAQAAIERAEQGDFAETMRLLGVLQRPFDEQPEHEADAGFPPDWARHIEVSCSS